MNLWHDGYKQGRADARQDLKNAPVEDFFHADSYRDGYHTALKDVRDGKTILAE
jgi:hypothetical protein